MAERTYPKEKVARLYNQKVERLARQAAERDGPLFDDKGRPSEDVTLGRLAELWDRRDPEVDEQAAWQEALSGVTEALAADPSLDREKLTAEVPIAVGMRVYPLRVKVLQGSGALGYSDLVTFADKVEAHAAKRRAGQVPTEGEDDA